MGLCHFGFRRNEIIDDRGAQPPPPTVAMADALMVAVRDAVLQCRCDVDKF
jgi:hypothetical protein